MSQCDGAVLVYDVMNEASFAAACELRNRFYQIRSSMARKEIDVKSTTSIFSKLSHTCCRSEQEQDVRIPPIYLVGTHAVSAYSEYSRS